MARCSYILLGVGIALLVLSIGFGTYLFPSLLAKKIKSQVRLEKGGDLFGRWIKVPIPIFMKIYLFNITNPSEFTSGKRPILAEIGPYVYEQRREKVVEKIHTENDTILYRPKLTYYFRPDMSAGLESDELNFINLPFLSVAITAMKAGSAQSYLVQLEAEDYEQTLFKKRTVGEFLFYGTHEPFIGEISKLKGDELMPNNTFGIYYGKNGTAQDLMEIYSGVVENEKFGDTISWNGKKQLSFWNTESCNMINGSDGSIFPPFVSRDRVIKIFSPDMCRSIYMKYVEDIELLGVPAYRFATPRDVLEDPRVNPENECYCLDPEDDMEGCSKAGVFRIGACRKGAPIVASWPHFYDGDPMYVNQSVGLKPDKSLHQTFISLEPNTGSLIQASKRFQINLELQRIKSYKELRKLPSMMLPILWVDESVMLNEENAEMINRKLLRPLKIGTMVFYGGMSVSAFLILIAVAFIFKGRNQKTINY